MDLKYNIRWIETTFPTKQVTETLLAPERESGNITSNDYEAATIFFPGLHRYYRFIGGLIGVPLVFALRRPSWTTARSYFFVTTASFAGFMVGNGLTLSAHFNFVRSIENPGGFAQAMDNIQHNIGIFPPPGPMIVRRGDQMALGGGTSDQPPPQRSSAPPEPADATTNDTPSPVKPTTKWEQIRAVNSRTSTNSSWDALRQNHERARVPSSSSSPPDSSDFDRTRGDDREAEQARFNELLEKERNMK